MLFLEPSCCCCTSCHCYFAPRQHPSSHILCRACTQYSSRTSIPHSSGMLPLISLQPCMSTSLKHAPKWGALWRKSPENLPGVCAGVCHQISASGGRHAYWTGIGPIFICNLMHTCVCWKLIIASSLTIIFWGFCLKTLNAKYHAMQTLFPNSLQMFKKVLCFFFMFVF